MLSAGAANPASIGSSQRNDTPRRAKQPDLRLADHESHVCRGPSAARRASTSSISAPASRTSRRPRRSSAAAHRAIDDAFTKYTPVGGTAELKRAICDRYHADYGVEYQRIRGDRVRGRETGALQHGDGALRPRRRGDHARAGTGRRWRAGDAGRSHAGPRLHVAEERLRDHSRADPGGGDGEDARHHHQLAVRIRPVR